MEEEIWKDIPGYIGQYKVSNYGRVRSLAREDSNGIRLRERILKPGRNVSGDGYYFVCLCKNGVAKNHQIHRLVVESFISPIPKGMVVDHIDENKLNNRLDNLRIITNHENLSRSTRGRFRKKNGNKMENNPRTKRVEVNHNGEISYLPCAKYISLIYNVGYSKVRHNLQKGLLRINDYTFKYETVG